MMRYFSINKRCSLSKQCQAIHFFADEGIKVNLRVNVDFDNISRIPEFLNEIKGEFRELGKE